MRLYFFHGLLRLKPKQSMKKIRISFEWGFWGRSPRNEIDMAAMRTKRFLALRRRRFPGLFWSMMKQFRKLTDHDSAKPNRHITS